MNEILRGGEERGKGGVIVRVSPRSSPALFPRLTTPHPAPVSPPLDHRDLLDLRSTTESSQAKTLRKKKEEEEINKGSCITLHAPLPPVYIG